MAGGATLSDVQQVFWKLITAPEGVKPGLAELVSRGELTAGTLPSWIVGDERLDAEGRLDIYANMYFYRLHDVLAEDFARVRKLLGAPRFHNLVTDYLLACPSSSYTLRHLGTSLPAFLETHESTRERPYLPDVARLEYARNEALQMEDSPVLTRAELAAVPPESWGDLRFTPTPWVTLLASAWDLEALFGELEGVEGDEPAEVTAAPAGERGHILVSRRNGRERHDVVDPEESRALAATFAGTSFAEVCEGLADDDDVEAAARRAALLLAGWLDRELLASYRT